MTEHLGRYEIKNLIGRGSFGDVYLGIDPALEREAAVKVLDPVVARDEEALQRFFQEARALAKLEHPRIAGVWEMGEDQGRYFIAMRYIAGQPLNALIEEHGPLSWEEAFRITIEVGEALQYAHDKGFVHRDIKPGNIIVHPENGAVLTDFGLVKALSGVSLTRTGMLVGTPEYMANEVISGSEASPASDQFALACVLVEMLTGASPFAAPTPMAVIEKHTKTVELPDAWDGDVPPGVTEVLRLALGRDPQARYRTVTAFTKSLSGKSVIQSMAQVKVTTPQNNSEPQLGDEYQLVLPGDLTMDFVYVPAGEFLMGAAEDDEDAEDDEKPQHKVYLDGYWIGKHPVTNIQFEAFVDASGHQTTAEEEGWGWVWDGNNWVKRDGAYWGAPEGPGGSIINRSDHPVVQVSWDDAHKYCMWLTRVNGQTIALPTEAEWEKAARGTDGRKYPWGNKAPSMRLANFNQVIGDTTPVDQYPGGASPYGALDMAGNVWEWCADWYDKDYYKKSPHKNPQGPGSGNFRVLRGGSWSSNDRVLRVSFRYWDYPGSRNFDLGFRCLLREAP